MKKQLHILQGLIILIIILIASLLSIKFIYKIKHEKLDTTYMWNINFTNLMVSKNSKKGDIKLEDNNINLELILEKENEFFEFTVDIENNGTLNAKLTDFNIIVENPKKILTYKITYIDKTEIKKGDILYSNDKKTILVRIDYPKQNNKIYEALKLKLSFNINYSAIQK